MDKKINFIVSDKSFEKFMMMVILGTTGNAMDVEMNFFCTFWGLYLLKKNFKPKVAGAPFPFKGIAAKVFKKRLKKTGIDDAWELIKEAVEDGKMKLYPCTTTMDLMGIKLEDMVDFVEKPIGAAGFLEMGEDGHIVSL